MANFERLIRGALASQDASSSEVRQVIYQSSRNALQKIIESNRSLTVEAVMEQKRQLEASIGSIEAEYNAPEPISSPEPVIPAQPIIIDDKPEEFIAPVIANEVAAPVEAPAKVAENDPLHEIQQILESTTLQEAAPEPISPAVQEQQVAEPIITEPVINVAAPQQEPSIQVEPVPERVRQDAVSIDTEQYNEQDSPLPEHYEEQESVPLGFSKRRKTQKRFLWTVITLIVLGLLAWISYIVVTGVLDGSLIGQNETNKPKLNPNAISRQADSENYITVIDAGDLSSLNTSGSGKAQIVNQLNSNMIRIHSIRNALNRSEPALPILIRLKPGVLKQISGKRVTVEIFAKAGGGETAHFAVGCKFGSLTECGRKRFLAGSQPNASVFAFQMDTISDINEEMFITLSTDTTSQAAVTGKGDILDVVYIRLSVDG